jgi:aspartate aminotransferase
VATPSLSGRTKILNPSPTLAITGRANALKAQGYDVISFGAGEPDFDTPHVVREAAKLAIDCGKTRYTPSSGIPELKQAVCAKFARDNKLDFSADQIVVSCGAKHALYNAMQVLIEPGDDVILIAPYWMTYADQALLAGANLKIIQTSAESGFIPSTAQLEAAVTDRTKAIVINSPSNPTGAVLPLETLECVAMLAKRHNFWIISDEIYERLIYVPKPPSIATLSADTKERTVTINGCSKTYAMTGWRIGYSASSPEIARAMSNLQDQVTSNPNSVAQHAAIAALQMPAKEVENMRAIFQTRRDLIVNLLANIPGIKILPPNGAFYAFADVRSVLRTCETDADLASALLEEKMVAVVPGAVFEGPGYIRLSYATSEEQITKGVTRIAEFFGERNT